MFKKQEWEVKVMDYGVTDEVVPSRDLIAANPGIAYW